MDTGLCAFLCRWPNAETIENGAMDGAFLETYVVSEIIKNYYNGGKPVDLWYYRDIDKKEVDLLIETADGSYPVEVKKTSTPKAEDARHFAVLETHKLKLKKGAVVCCCPEVMPLPNRNAVCIPASLI